MTERTRPSTLNVRRSTASSTASALTSRLPAAVAASAAVTATTATARTVQSHAVLQGLKQIGIEHNGEIYYLRTTRLGKLILTK
ncbi:hemin uptake protein HemP [Paraburkholderia hayleyella]|uniref:hemin uptake protein HemP n=1 Tax=Paraburkholderia hayleyella TaxID=2152889 RepID=UPI0012923FF9|nr:hemin uptake protein HemP [Paraburkholderia hayleyella]